MITNIIIANSFQRRGRAYEDRDIYVHNKKSEAYLVLTSGFTEDRRYHSVPESFAKLIRCTLPLQIGNQLVLRTLHQDFRR